MTNLTNNNFHFPKSIEASHGHMPQHQRHLVKEVLTNGNEESYASNLINRAQPSNIQFMNNNEVGGGGGGEEQMIWRVV